MENSKLNYLFLPIVFLFLGGWDSVCCGLRECCGCSPRLYKDFVDYGCE